jgi:hypothetical protein
VLRRGCRARRAAAALATGRRSPQLARTPVSSG